MKIQELIKTEKFIASQQARFLLSESLFDKIFRFYPNSKPFFSTGAYRATDFLGYESYFIVSNTANSTFRDISKFMDYVNNFNDAYLLIVEQASSDSKKRIEVKINDMIVFVTLFAVLLIGIFIVFYYPMLKYEAMVVRWLAGALNLIPRKV